jgi:Tol biopolymer transport system component
MRKTLIILLLLTSLTFAQHVEVNSIIELTRSGNFMVPKFSPDGNRLIFTCANYTGLWLYDFTSQKLSQLNDYPGAGYEPAFSNDGNILVFRKDDYEQQKRLSTLIQLNLQNKTETKIENQERNLTPAQYLNDGTIVYRKRGLLQACRLKQTEKQSVSPDQQSFVYAELGQIVLWDKGKQKILKPLADQGVQHYLWTSLSPDKTSLLFTAPGLGTFISDLDGNILTEVGYANAPKWSPDGQWIVYMVDQDDGHQITASDIWISAADGSASYQLTDTPEIFEMNPCWSPDMHKIACDNQNGQILVINLEIKD